MSIALEYSNSKDVTARNLAAQHAAAIAFGEWHELMQPPVFEEDDESAPRGFGAPFGLLGPESYQRPMACPPARAIFIVNVTDAGLSEIAKHHLRREIEYRRHNGQPAPLAAEWAREWCRGYAAQNGSGPRPGGSRLLPTTAYFDGQDYARGENAYWRCMAEAEDDVVFAGEEV